MALTDPFRRSRPSSAALQATTPAPREPPPPVNLSADPEESLDTLGALLHALGKESFDIGDEPAARVRRPLRAPRAATSSWARRSRASTARTAR